MTRSGQNIVSLIDVLFIWLCITNRSKEDAIIVFQLRIDYNIHKEEE